MSPFEAWVAEDFSEVEGAAGVMTALLADSDADGLGNAVEFGSSLDPGSAESAHPIDVLRGAIPGEKIVKYRRRTLPRGVRTMIEKSINLQDWQPCHAADLEILTVKKTSGWGVEIVTARLISEPAGQAPVKYLRLRVMIED